MAGRVVLGRYRIVAPLARGGMGIVYLGRIEGAAGFSKPVVIKTVIPDAKDARAAQLFVREARILSNLEHPSIVGVLDFGEVDGEYIMVLEYIHGFHLGAWWRYVREARGVMPVAHAVEVMLPVLEALEFAHQLKKPDGTPLGIVHRDVSPANILLDQQGHVKLHDFGIARMADDEFKTQDGSFRGTLSFAAPETLQGIPASARSDLYACGVVLYQLLAGANPFRGDQPSETLHRVMSHVPPPLAVLRADVPEAISRAIACALEKDPEQRFATCELFAAALRAGRAWAAADAQAELAEAIQKDFGSTEMPTLLGVETLQSRDAAWRASQAPQERTPLSSSRPPGATPREAVTETAESAARARSAASPSSLLPQSARTAARSATGQDAIATARPPRDASRATPLVEALPPGKPRSRWLLLLVAVASAFGLAGVAFGLMRKEAAPPTPKFLLIEKQAEAEAEPAAVTSEPPVPLPLPAPVGSVARAAASAGVAPGAVVKPRASEAASGSTLTAAFQKQRGRIEGCFQRSPDAATPQLTLRFQVEANGGVHSVELSPASVAGSPLGGCILGVARGTRFPAGPAPVAFTIPITARKTAN